MILKSSKFFPLALISIFFVEYPWSASRKNNHARRSDLKPLHKGVIAELFKNLPRTTVKTMGGALSKATIVAGLLLILTPVNETQTITKNKGNW